MEGGLESGGNTTAADKDPRVRTAKAQGRKKGRGERALETMRELFSARLKLGARSGREEPTPPSSPGTYLRSVNTVDGSIEYVKVKSQVSRPAQI